MQTVKLSTEWEGPGNRVSLNVTILFFKEDSTYFAYIPSFDLTGYGYSQKEAEKSLGIALDEFLRYTTNKNTLFKELRRLGWKFRSKSKPIIAPAMSDMVNTNNNLKDIINNKPFSTSNFQVQIPAYA